MATWLPNQLSVVLNAIDSKSKLLRTNFAKSKSVDWDALEVIEERAQSQLRVLNKDVAEFKKKFGDI
jgi:hypothetical protein